jgi:hypothetical protein
MAKHVTADEQTVIAILTEFGETNDGRKEPYRAVERTTGWDTPTTDRFVRDLEQRRLVVLAAVVGHGRPFEGKFQWVKGPDLLR